MEINSGNKVSSNNWKQDLSDTGSTDEHLNLEFKTFRIKLCILRGNSLVQ